MEINKSEIRSVKFRPNGGLEITYIQTPDEDGIPSNKEYKFKNDRVPHGDLYTIFRGLLAHAAILADLGPKDLKIDAKYIKNRKSVEDPNFLNYRVIGIEIKDDMNGELAVLTLQKRLSKGGSYDFKIPAVKLYSESSYEFSGNLVDDLGMCLDEVIEYTEGKYQESNQLSLHLDGDEEQF